MNQEVQTIQNQYQNQDVNFFLMEGEDDYQSSWSDLKNFLQSLTTPTKRQVVSMEYYYQKVQHLCLIGQDQQLYESFKEHCDFSIHSQYYYINGTDQECYTQFYQMITLLTKNSIIMEAIFSYFQYTVLIHTPYKTVRGLMISLLHECIKSNLQLLVRVCQHISMMINLWRQQNIIKIESYINTDIFKELKYMVELFKELGLYESNIFFQRLEKQHDNQIFSLVEYLLQHSITYYEALSLDLSKDFNYQNYLQKAYIGYNLETLLEQNLFPLSLQYYDKMVLHREMGKFEACFEPLDNSDVQYLPLLFWYFMVQDKKNVFRKLIYAWVHREGTKIISNQDSTQTIEDLIKLNDRVQEFIVKYFKNDMNIKLSSDDALEDLILTKVNTLSQLFSKFLDEKLTKSSLSIKDESRIITEIDKALSIFKFFTAKDIFETFFTQRLTKRILLDLSYSYDIEYQVFKKLKLECGDQYIRKAQDIMQDVFNQKQVTDEFLDYAQVSNYTVPIQLQITIIQSSAWTLDQIKMPQSIQPFGGIQELFQKFFTEQTTSKKKIEWQLECSNCYVEATFQSDKYKLHVSVVQAIILLLFNNSPQLSFQEIDQQLPGIGQKEIFKSLSAFCMMAEPLLINNSQGKTIKLDDIFSLNTNFKNKKKMIRVNQSQKRETKEQVEEITSKVLNERQYMIDASIIKYMKRVKSAQLNLLVKEVMQDLKLPLQAKDIKIQIEYLLQKDYLERDQEQMNLFHYLA